MLVQREVATLLRFSPRWKRSGQVYSHNVIAWSNQCLVVNIFFLNYSRRRFRFLSTAPAPPDSFITTT